MNFNVYIPKDKGDKITKVAKTMHRSRNSIINEALDEWLGRHLPSKWPSKFFDFKPIDDVPDFKLIRSELKDQRPEDPLA